MKYRKTLKRYDIIYLTIVFAMLSATLRLSASGMSSLYRLSAPFVAGAVLMKCFRAYLKDTIVFGALMAYSVLVSALFYNVQADFVGFAGYLFFLWIIIKYLKLKDKNFDKAFFDFLHFCTVITIMLAWLQLVTRYTLPYTHKMSPKAVCVYFHNENEFSEAMGCMFAIYSYLIMIKKRYIYIPLAGSIFVFSFLNDAKLTAMGDVVIFAIILMYQYRLSGRKLIDRKTFFRIAGLLGIFTIVLVYAFNIQIKFRDYTMSIRKLLFDPIYNIATGNAIRGGSIQDRTNTIIFGLKELKKTYGFGIGFGNSVQMLKKPAYRKFLYNAESMHNAIIQLLVEFGYVAMILYCKIIKKIIDDFGKIGRDNTYLLKCAFAVGFVFLSSQSSVGIFSNYFTWTVVIYIVLMSKK